MCTFSGGLPISLVDLVGSLTGYFTDIIYFLVELIKWVLWVISDFTLFLMAIITFSLMYALMKAKREDGSFDFANFIYYSVMPVKAFFVFILDLIGRIVRIIYGIINSILPV